MAVAPALGIDLMRPLLATLLLAPGLVAAEYHVVIVEGLGGEDRYRDRFREQTEALERAARTVTSGEFIRVFRGAEANREAILAHFESLADELGSDDTVAVYLVGHGSYDEHEYKFNLPGPDLTGEDLSAMTAALPSSNQLLVNTSSASGASAELLGADNRIVIAATRSGAERHATYFGSYFVLALDEPSADLDKNRVITAQEAFDYADRRVADYFETNGQLATEHARLEGSRADRFNLARLGRAEPESDDPELIELLANRDTLNRRIDEVRLRRDSMPPDEYQAALLEQLLALAELEERIEQRRQELGLND